MKAVFFGLLFVSLLSYRVSGQGVRASKLFVDRSHTALLYTDEDFKPIQIIGPANDQNYTMGLGFGYSCPAFNQFFVFEPNRFLARAIIGKKFLDQAHVSELSPSLTLNGTAFTPLNLRAKTPVIGDRPYAFLLTLSTKKTFLDEQKHQTFTSELNVGVLGTKIGQWVQTKIHKDLIKDTANTPIPQGWDNQISKGGEPTFLYSLSYDKLLWGFGKGPSRLLEFKYGVQVTAGYYTGIAGNLSARIGLLDSRNWFRNYAQLQNQASLSPSKYAGAPKAELFLFGMVRPVYTIYNELLQGGFRNRDAYHLTFDETQQARLEWNFGVGVTLPQCKCTNRSLVISWMLNAGRTSELNTAFRRTHQWGTVNLAWNW